MIHKRKKIINVRSTKKVKDHGDAVFLSPLDEEKLTRTYEIPSPNTFVSCKNMVIGKSMEKM